MPTRCTNTRFGQEFAHLHPIQTSKLCIRVVLSIAASSQFCISLCARPVGFTFPLKVLERPSKVKDLEQESVHLLAVPEASLTFVAGVEARIRAHAQISDFLPNI